MVGQLRQRQPSIFNAENKDEVNQLGQKKNKTIDQTKQHANLDRR